MELLEQYFDIQKKIYQHFDYEEDWHVLPLSNETDKHWFIDSGRVAYSGVPFTEQGIITGDTTFSGKVARVGNSCVKI